MVNIAMIGVGAISGIYLKNLTETFSEVKLIGVCDLIRERAENAKEKYNVPRIYDTMYDAFNDPEVNIILNLTRPYEHFEVTRARPCLRANMFIPRSLWGRTLRKARSWYALPRRRA